MIEQSTHNSTPADELAPCPFCGETMYLACCETIASAVVRWWQVECACGASAGCCGSEAQAIAAWNTRQPPSDATIRHLLQHAVNAYDVHQAGTDWGGVMPIEEWIEKSRAALAQDNHIKGQDNAG